MLKQIETEPKNSPWLRSMSPCLISPDSPLIRTLTGHSDWVLRVAVTPDGRRAVSASNDKTLKVWDLESGKCITTFSGEGAFICCMIANDGKTIIAGDNTGRIYFLYCEGI
jgi:WD40 repeat protein